MNFIKNIKNKVAQEKFENKLFALDRILGDMTERDIANYNIMIEYPKRVTEEFIKLNILNEYLYCFSTEEVIYLKRIIRQQADAEMSRYTLLNNLNHEFTSEELENELVSYLANGEYNLDIVENLWKKYIFEKNCYKLFDFEIVEWEEKLGLSPRQR